MADHLPLMAEMPSLDFTFTLLGKAVQVFDLLHERLDQRCRSYRAADPPAGNKYGLKTVDRID